MPTFRDFQAKLNGLQTMRRVTLTMKMVAATRLHQAQAALQKSEPYGAALADALNALRSRAAPGDSRLLGARVRVRNGLLLICTSDRGLCGSANTVILRAAERWLADNRARFSILRASFSGKRGWQHFRNRIEVRNRYEGSAARPDPEMARRIGQDLCETFLTGRYDEITVFYNRFFTPAYQEATVLRLLPLGPEALGTPPAPAALPPDSICEPSGAALVDRLLRQFVRFRVYEALLHQAASEHGARMAAMENATSNIDRLMEETRLERNRRRQGAITREISEIVSGAEALA